MADWENTALRISETASEATRAALEQFATDVIAARQDVERSLSFYARSPGVVSDVVEFLAEHPERFSILRDVVVVMDTNADQDLEFSDEEAATIMKSDEFKKLRKEVDAERDKEIGKNRMRRFWLRRAMGHIAAA